MPAAEWKPGAGPLMTKWGKEFSPANVHPEYPRPQLVREKWTNLNGLWDYAVAPGLGSQAASTPAKYDGQILVPFPIESALSGVMKRVGTGDQLIYHRTLAEGHKGWPPPTAPLRRGGLEVRSFGEWEEGWRTYGRL